MALLPIDRDLLQRCLAKQPGAWNDFVDRFLAMIYHVVQYTAHLRSARLDPADVEDIAAEILLQIVAEDYKVLRQFRGNANLATYLTVIARRISVHELNRRQTRDTGRKADGKHSAEAIEDNIAAQKGVESLEEVEKLLRKLSGQEREVVRLFYLEGRTYEEISSELELPVNTIGTILSRARTRLREISGVPAAPPKKAAPKPAPKSGAMPAPKSSVLAKSGPPSGAALASSGPPSSGPKTTPLTKPKPSASGPPSGMIPKSALPPKTGSHPPPQQPPSGPKKTDK